MQIRENLADGDALTETKIWYFAYGSNMKSSVMAGRGISPFDTKSVIIPSYTLTFDIFGIPYSEPSFASIAQFATVDGENHGSAESQFTKNIPPVHGVAYFLSQADYKRLVVTEGGG